MTDSEDVLLAKILDSVRVEIVHPMVMHISKVMNGKITDTHVFEVPIGMSIPEVQKDVTRIVGKWKGGFPVGTRYIVERLKELPEST